ncbi:hypothetical protein MCC01989_02560 [Bifidobacteriaceae bacterium MCC01989]|nr:hypothetical protein CE161_01235 [Bifidobacterium longum]GDZ74993.1 hypothetical protein MCC01989_02560 [Bifidobacteriaceae bacterium MCC01989]
MARTISISHDYRLPPIVLDVLLHMHRGSSICPSEQAECVVSDVSNVIGNGARIIMNAAILVLGAGMGLAGR